MSATASWEAVSSAAEAVWETEPRELSSVPVESCALRAFAVAALAAVCAAARRGTDPTAKSPRLSFDTLDS